MVVSCIGRRINAHPNLPKGKELVLENKTNLYNKIELNSFYILLKRIFRGINFPPLEGLMEDYENNRSHQKFKWENLVFL